MKPKNGACPEESGRRGHVLTSTSTQAEAPVRGDDERRSRLKRNTAALSRSSHRPAHRLDPEEYLRCLIRLVPLWPNDRILELAPLFCVLPDNATRAGLSLRIGAHSDTLWAFSEWTRMPAIARAFALDRAEIDAANEFGGLIYIDVPNTTNLGTITVRPRGEGEGGGEG